MIKKIFGFFTRQLIKYLPNKTYKKKLISSLSDKKRNIIIFSIPQHVNLGDQAIAYAEKEFILKNFPKDNYIEIPADSTILGIRYLKSKVKSDDVILIHGGGNMGDLYIVEEINRRLVINAFKNNKVISMPQSIYFSETKKGKKILEKSRKIYSGNTNLVLFAREKMSYEKMKESFPHNKVELCPDIVFSLKSNDSSFSRKGIITLIRNDREAILNSTERNNLFYNLSKKKKLLNKSDTKLNTRIVIDSESIRKQILEDKWNEISGNELAITDRLHGMIFCYVTKTPAIVFDNNYKKVSESYNAWLSDCGFIKFLDSYSEEKLDRGIEEVLSANLNEQELDSYFIPLVSELQY